VNAVHEKAFASIQPAGTGGPATTFGCGGGSALVAAAGGALAAAAGGALAAAGGALAEATGDAFATSGELASWRGAPPSLGRRDWADGPQSTAISKRKNQHRTEASP